MNGFSKVSLKFLLYASFHEGIHKQNKIPEITNTHAPVYKQQVDFLGTVTCACKLETVTPLQRI